MPTSWFRAASAILTMTVVALTACGRSDAGPGTGSSPAKAVASGTPADSRAPAALAPVATVRDVMTAIIDPSADFIWESVQIEATRTGTTRKAPSTDDEWAAVRRHALTIAEAANLLQLPGRAVAPAEDVKPVEGSMDLPPAAVEALIAGDHDGWLRRARGLQDAARTALAAAERKDVNALLAAGETLDSACEACHSTYWYPEKKP